MSNEKLIAANNKPGNITEAKIANENKNPYHITFNLETTEVDNIYELSVNMELFDGAYFLSPSSDNMFMGKIDISIEKNKYLELDSNYSEKPAPVEEEDPFGNGPTMVQRVNTSYRKTIKINTSKDFKQSGMVMFTIEPKCTLEKIAYTISSKAGKLTVEQQ